MEDIQTSMTVDKIHGISLDSPIRHNPFGRSFAVTIDGRQWTRLFRDRNKSNGGWIEIHPSETKLASASKLNGANSSIATTNVNSECGLCTVTHGYGDEDVNGEFQLQLVTMLGYHGEINPWGLFVGRESGKGEMLQVKGGWQQMDHAYETTENVFADLNYRISRIYTMARNLTPLQLLWIKEIASSVQPPSASEVHKISGNSQTWCIEVLYKLVGLGLATKDLVVKADLVYRQALPYEKESDARFKAMVGGGWAWVSRGGWATVDEEVAKG